ncbi:hypothetical protein [Amycolatopsis sp. cmx-4-61]|uniref:hypothetical protein n=1 Tax=Amycolatopsis sp. cmx-4-61 TaxID=2790937 RepID=UPI00397C54A2
MIAAFGLVGAVAVHGCLDLTAVALPAPLASMVVGVGLFVWLHRVAPRGRRSAKTGRGPASRAGRSLFSGAGVAVGAGLLGGGRLLSGTRDARPPVRRSAKSRTASARTAHPGGKTARSGRIRRRCRFCDHRTGECSLLWLDVVDVVGLPGQHPQHLVELLRDHVSGCGIGLKGSLQVVSGAPGEDDRKDLGQPPRQVRIEVLEQQFLGLSAFRLRRLDGTLPRRADDDPEGAVSLEVPHRFFELLV